MNINNVIARAQKMMLDENWNRQVEMGAAAHRAGSINGGGSDLSALEAQAFGSSQSSASANYYTPIPESAMRQPAHSNATSRNDGIEILRETKREINPTTSKLPKAVLESFAQNPSPLDSPIGYDLPPASYYGQPEMITEQAPSMQYAAAPSPTPSAGIDYTYIKYLIKEAISEQANILKENTTMNNFRGMRIADGNVIQFIDAKGNLYEGVLKLKKKAK